MRGRCSQKRRSCATIATSGAFSVFSRLVAASAGRSFSRDSLDLRYTMRIGWLLALVGPHFISSCAARNRFSSTGLSAKSLCERALRRRRSSKASSLWSSAIIAPMMDLASVIRPGDAIIVGQACAEPQTLVEALVSQRARLGTVGCFLGLSYSGIVRPEHADHLRLSSYCGSGTNRALPDAGLLDLLPA